MNLRSINECDAFRWDALRQTYRAWWRDELERPLIAVTVHDADPGRPAPPLAPQHVDAAYDFFIPPEQVVEAWDWILTAVFVPPAGRSSCSARRARVLIALPMPLARCAALSSFKAVPATISTISQSGWPLMALNLG